MAAKGETFLQNVSMDERSDDDLHWYVAVVGMLLCSAASLVGVTLVNHPAINQFSEICFGHIVFLLQLDEPNAAVRWERRLERIAWNHVGLVFDLNLMLCRIARSLKYKITKRLVLPGHCHLPGQGTLAVPLNSVQEKQESPPMRDTFNSLFQVLKYICLNCD